MPQPYERIKTKRKEIIINNLIGGIAWSVGATIGLSLVVAVITVVLKKVSLVPVVGSFVAQVAAFVAKNSHTFK
jgi:hypothetical protein